MLKNQSLFIFFFLLTGLGFGQIQFHRYDSIEVFNGANKYDLAWFGGLKAPQFSKIDLDIDGTEDLFVFDRADNKVMTFINLGTPGATDYRYAPEYESKFPPLDSWALLRDFNGDGKKDIYAQTTAGIKVYKNISTPSTGLEFDMYKPLVISYNGFDTVIDSTKFGNLYVISTDIPAIYDVDHDGDLDIITFAEGTICANYMAYYRNMSQENFGHSDSLDYYLKNLNWGYFSESGASTNRVILNDSCFYNVTDPQLTSRHTGSSVMAFDNNDDGVTDLLIGDVSFRNMVMVLNGGSAPNTNSKIISQDTAFPSYDTTIDLELFPAGYYEDVDNDGVKDLLCAPNTDILVENYTSAHFYKNNGTNTLPNFDFIKRNFLQDEGIELGEQSMITFFDHNADGLLDMIVSSYGYFQKSTISYKSKIALFENTGTVSNPEFTFVTDDYQNISSLGLGLGLYPTFADIDNDNDIDMIIGDSEGKLHLFTNTAGFGATASFTLTLQNMVDNLSSTIDVGQFATPQLYDFDGDTDYDLIIGEKNGIVNYYENIGSTSAYNFQFVTDSMGEVEIHEPWDINGAVTGFSTPYFFEEAGTTYMVSGGQQGEVYLYGNINSANPLAAFTIIDTLINKSEIGYHTTTTLFDINNDNKTDLFIGNLRGGVATYYGGSQTVNVSEISNSRDIKFYLYPNPASDYLTVEMEGGIYQTDNINLKVLTIDGRLIHNQVLNTNKVNINTESFTKGIYLITIENNGVLTSRRFIKE